MDLEVTSLLENPGPQSENYDWGPELDTIQVDLLFFAKTDKPIIFNEKRHPLRCRLWNPLVQNSNHLTKDLELLAMIKTAD